METRNVALRTSKLQSFERLGRALSLLSFYAAAPIRHVFVTNVNYELSGNLVGHSTSTLFFIFFPFILNFLGTNIKRGHRLFLLAAVATQIAIHTAASKSMKLLVRRSAFFF